MRVAVIAEWYPSAADPVHGIWAHRQAVACAQQGVEIRVLALRRPVPPLSAVRRLAQAPPDPAPLRAWMSGVRPTLRTETRDGIAVQPVAWLGPPRPISYGSWGYWMAPPLRRALDRLHQAWKFDVLHAHCLAPAGHAAALWARRPGGHGHCAFVVSAHGPDMIHVPQHSAVGRRACLTALREADLVIANSSWAKRRCETLAGGSLPTSVVHLGADLLADPGAGPVAALRAPDRELTLVTIAHLQARKHHDVVMRALARIHAEYPMRYLVIGDGEHRAALEALACQLGIADRVDFLGQLPNDVAVARLAQCDLFVMPSVEEPFGVAFVEAMAAGVPAIGSRGEGGPEDIAAAGEGMLLVSPDDPVQLGGELARLADDPQERRRLGAAARATAAAHFTWERCGAATVSAYREALARRGS